MSTLRYKNLTGETAAECNRLVEYYNNQQLEYVKAMLDGNFKGGYGKRRDWKNRGIIPRARNITKSIVDKSAMAFNQPPVLETYSANKTVVPNPTLDTLLYNADWIPFWQNVAALTRLLKTVVVYQQKYIPLGSVTENQIYKYNPFNGEALKQCVTHRGNSQVVTDPTGRFIVEYAYLTDMDPEYYPAHCDTVPVQYIVVTPMEIETWVYYDEKDYLVDVQPNPEGFVPAFFVHDTNKPIYESWNTPGVDLGNLNEMVNLHITDTEFAVAWQKAKTLFTNGNFASPDVPMQPQPMASAHTDPGQSYSNDPRYSTAPSTGGLGSIVQITSDDNSRDPMIKFDGPDTNLQELNDVIRELARDVAYDWSVNIKVEGNGGATSGFQLVVEEMDNLNLRQKQMQYFQSAFRVMYEMLQRMYPELPQGQLLVKFAPPQLPVNEKEREEVWLTKIDSGRASIIDYLMETQNLTEQEAIEKAIKIKTFNETYGPGASVAVVEPTVPVIDANQTE